MLTMNFDRGAQIRLAELAKRGRRQSIAEGAGKNQFNLPDVPRVSRARVSEKLAMM